MFTRIPPETNQLFERKFSHQDFSSKSGREIADLVWDATKDFDYGWGRCRAFANLVLFPWPHEVEQLREVCCGTKALYRFLALNFLRTRYNLSIDPVFLFGQNHAKVGVSSSDGDYILDGSVDQVRRFDPFASQLDLEEVILLVEHIRSQNPLDILKTDQVILRSELEGITNDLTAKYDGGVVFNVVRYNKLGATIGAWIKLSTESGEPAIRRTDYISPGDYRKWTNFDNEKCIEHDEKASQVLRIQEPALRCIALDEIYSSLISHKLQTDPDAITVHPKERIQRIRESELEELGEENFFKKNKYRDIIAIHEYRNLYSRSIIDSYRDYQQLEDTIYINRRKDYNIDFMKRVRSFEEIDHSLFVERLKAKPTAYVVALAQRMLRIPALTEDNLILRYFAKLDDSFKALKQEESLPVFVRKITEAYLGRHGRTTDLEHVTNRLLRMLQ